MEGILYIRMEGILYIHIWLYRRIKLYPQLRCIGSGHGTNTVHTYGGYTK